MNATAVNAALSGSILTRRVKLFKEANTCVCGRCRGTGFDGFTANRSSRKCPRCKGKGFTKVGGTKR